MTFMKETKLPDPSAWDMQVTVEDLTPLLRQRRWGQGSSRTRKQNVVAFVFLLPWLAGLLIFTVGPMLASLYYSFTSYDLLSAPQWVGLDNYVRMFTQDGRYLTALKVTFIYVFVSVPLKLAFSLLLAVLLSKGLRAVGLYRAVYYVPSLLGGSVAIAILWSLPGFHICFNCDEWRPCRCHAVLYALPLSAGIWQLSDGLCSSDGLGLDGDSHGIHCSHILYFQVLGILSRWEKLA